MSTIVLAVSALVCATAFRLLGEEVQKGYGDASCIPHNHIRQNAARQSNSMCFRWERMLFFLGSFDEVLYR